MLGPTLSVVIPARNEERRLPHTLARLSAFAAQFHRKIEVLVVDDHSDDATACVAHSLVHRLNIRTLSCAKRGPGAAMRYGLERASAERILLCDADGPVPFDEIETLDRALDQGADIAAGSRLVGHAERPPRPVSRRILAQTFRTARNLLTPVSVLDTQCGFKLIRQEVLQTVLPNAVLDGFVFHVELLARAQAQGFVVTEVGVPWRDVPGSSIHPIRDPVLMAGELFHLRAALRRAGEVKPSSFEVDKPSRLKRNRV